MINTGLTKDPMTRTTRLWLSYQGTIESVQFHPVFLLVLCKFIIGGTHIEENLRNNCLCMFECNYSASFWVKRTPRPHYQTVCKADFLAIGNYTWLILAPSLLWSLCVNSLIDFLCGLVVSLCEIDWSVGEGTNNNSFWFYFPVLYG